MNTFATESAYIQAARKVPARSGKKRVFEPVVVLFASQGHSRREPSKRVSHD